MSAPEDNESVTEDAAEVVAPGSVEEDNHDSHDPSNADIIARLDELPSAIAAAVADALKPDESPAEPESHDAPGDGEVIPQDSSPASVPWTHRGLKG